MWKSKMLGINIKWGSGNGSWIKLSKSFATASFVLFCVCFNSFPLAFTWIFSIRIKLIFFWLYLSCKWQKIFGFHCKSAQCCNCTTVKVVWLLGETWRERLGGSAPSTNRELCGVGLFTYFKAQMTHTEEAQLPLYKLLTLLKLLFSSRFSRNPLFHMNRSILQSLRLCRS